MLAGLVISLRFLHVSDKILEKIFTFSTAFARTGYIHNLLYSIRSVPNGILDHAICDIFALTRLFPAIQSIFPPSKILIYFTMRIRENYKIIHSLRKKAREPKLPGK